MRSKLRNISEREMFLEVVFVSVMTASISFWLAPSGRTMQKATLNFFSDSASPALSALSRIAFSALNLLDPAFISKTMLPESSFLWMTTSGCSCPIFSMLASRKLVSETLKRFVVLSVISSRGMYFVLNLSVS